MATKTDNKNGLKWIAIGFGSILVLGYLNRKRVVNNLNIQLSENFNLREFITTSTGIENIPGPAEIEKIRALVINTLQPARNAVSKKYPGKKIVWKITSGYRSPLVNTAIGGSRTSQHPKGEAADSQVFVDGVQIGNQELIDIIRSAKVPYDQLIDEDLNGKKWVHVSYSTTLRKQWMTARNNANGGTVYTTIKFG